MQEAGRIRAVAARLAAATRVLSVEDDPDIADFLRAYFRASGYDLVHLDPGSAVEVVEAVERYRPDCVLLDIGLRGFSGHEAYRLIRSDRALDFLPVIVVTADATASARTADLARGIDGFLAKPFNVNTLAGVVAERIAAARALGERGVDEAFGVMSQAYLDARLADEVVIASDTRTPLSFAIVQLQSRSALVAEIGDEALAFVVREVARRARRSLPGSAVFGRGRSDELAILLPGMMAADAERALRSALTALDRRVDLPGGAAVTVALTGGLACCPDHAGTADELYMAADAALTDASEGGHLLALAI